MRKTDRSAAREGISAGRLEYLEAARKRIQNRRLRRTALLVVLVAAVVIYLTGAVNASVTLLEDFADSVRIALMPEQGFPQQTGVGNVYQAAALGDSFVVLGEDGCAVFADSGGRLNAISTGYARPAIAAAGNRFVLYNRSGTELRVESRTRTLYTRQTSGSIFLCALSRGGELAVVTDDGRRLAVMTVYDEQMEELLTWELTSEEGVPIRLAFSPDGTQIAAAAVTARDGQIITNLYLINLRQGEPNLLATEAGSVPLELYWPSDSRLLAVCDTHVALYGSDGGAIGRREFGGATLAGLSVKDDGLALLFGSGQSNTVLLLDTALNSQYEGTVPVANGITRGSGCFYLFCDSSIECFSLAGEYQWSAPLEAQPQAMLAGQELLVFTENMVRRIAPPVREETED